MMHNYNNNIRKNGIARGRNLNIEERNVIKYGYEAVSSITRKMIAFEIGSRESKNLKPLLSKIYPMNIYKIATDKFFNI